MSIEGALWLMCDPWKAQPLLQPPFSTCEVASLSMAFSCIQTFLNTSDLGTIYSLPKQQMVNQSAQSEFIFLA